MPLLLALLDERSCQRPWELTQPVPPRHSLPTNAFSARPCVVIRPLSPPCALTPVLPYGLPHHISSFINAPMLASVLSRVVIPVAFVAFVACVPSRLPSCIRICCLRACCLRCWRKCCLPIFRGLGADTVGVYPVWPYPYVCCPYACCPYAYCPYTGCAYAGREYPYCGWLYVGWSNPTCAPATYPL